MPMAPHASGAQEWKVKPENLEACSTQAYDNFAVAPADSQLEAIIVFSENKRKKELNSMLKAEWMPESFIAYEEEVLKYGMFDVVFDHTFFFN